MSPCARAARARASAARSPAGLRQARRARSSIRPRPPASRPVAGPRRTGDAPVARRRRRRESAGRRDDRRARRDRPFVAAMAAAAPTSATTAATGVGAPSASQRRPCDDPAGVATRTPHVEAVLLPARERLPAARADRHSAASDPAGRVDVPPPSGRPQVAQKRAPRRSGAPQMQSAPPPPRRTRARPVEQRVDLLDACLDRDELGAALDDEPRVEPVALVHLERKPAEVAQSLFAHLEQRLALALELTRRRNDVPGRGRRRSRAYRRRMLSHRRTT